jgi:hypothetical protein
LDRIDSTDVLSLIRTRTVELERQVASLTKQNSVMATRIAELKGQREHWRVREYEARKSRDKWTAKAKDRRYRIEVLEKRIRIMGDPSHPFHLKLRGKIKVAA